MYWWPTIYYYPLWAVRITHDSGKRSQQEVVLFLSFLVLSCMRCTAVLTAFMSLSFVVPYNSRLLSLRTADRRTFLLHLELPFSHFFFLPFFLSTGCLFAVWLSLSYYWCCLLFLVLLTFTFLILSICYYYTHVLRGVLFAACCWQLHRVVLTSQRPALFISTFDRLQRHLERVLVVGSHSPW